MFVEKISKDFDEPWNIIKEDGSILTLNLNKNCNNPTLTYGLYSLKAHYHFKDNVEVKFDYYGLNLFKVSMWKEVKCHTQIPTEIKYFDIDLRGSQLEEPKLVYYFISLIFF